MKRNLLTAFILGCLSLATVAQDMPKFASLDKSPADIAVYRSNNGTIARVVYGRPQKNGREIFGNLVAYDKVWRTGANEATEITFFQDVTLGDQSVSAGTYTLFTIPGEDEWTIILNSELNQWGNYRHDKSKDVIKAKANVYAIDDELEAFTIAFTKSGMLTLAWDKTMAQVQIK